MTRSKTKGVVTPMDDGIREAVTGAPATNTQRVCYAIKTLVAEVHSLFPETPVEYSNFNGRNTALDVTFDPTGIPDADRGTFIALFGLFDLDADPRIDYVISADDGVLVSMKSSPRTQDSREPFGLPAAYLVLAGEDDEDEITDFDPLNEGTTVWEGSL